MIDTGGSAFPCGPGGGSFTGPDGYTTHQFPGSEGMTLRDWFAGMALQGLLAKLLADAMIAARETR